MTASRRRPDDMDAEASTPRIAVTVTRTGGLAGLRREWSAGPPPDREPQWIALIENCPWDAIEGGPGKRGADRFVWRIRARCGGGERAAELADEQVSGPWRALVDAVRDTATP